MKSTEMLCAIIDSELEGLGFASRQPGELYLPVEYVLSSGGKRLRPVISLMACELFSPDLSNAVKPAVALEIFHNFTLIHDDIMDKADLRRGRPTIHRKWDLNRAILSGDAMMVLSFQLISSVNTAALPGILGVFTRTALEVCEGQQLDMNFETMPEVNESMYLEMIRLKTSVLIAAAMKIGALSGGASEADADLMYDSGLNLGLAFQIQDDLLDLYGNQEKFGKKSGGDILLNKKTFLLVAAREKAGDKELAELDRLMGRENDPDARISGVKKIFDKLDVRGMAEKRANDYFQKALEKLNATTPPPSSKSVLESFIKTVMKRKN